MLLLALIVISVLWQVFSRYILNSPSSFTEEIARFLFIWLGLFGAAYASGQQAHLAINLLPPKLNQRNRTRLRIGINILIILFCLSVLVIGGGNMVYVSYILGQSSAALNLPLFIVYSVAPLSGIMIVGYKVNEIIWFKKYLV